MNHKLQRFLHTEMNKLKQMSKKDRIWYIWEYYKVPILGFLMVSFLATSIGSAMYQNRFDTAISCAILNRKYSDKIPNEDYFQKGFRQYLGLDEDTFIRVDTSMPISYAPGQPENMYTHLAKLTALIAANDLDIIIADKETIDYYASISAFYDLETILPTDFSEDFKDQFVYSTTEEGIYAAYGISLENTSFMEKANMDLRDPVLAVIHRSSNIENSTSLIRYIFQ